MIALTGRTLSCATPSTLRPAYDRAGVTAGIVHIGVGNFHRAHQAAYLDTLLAHDPRARAFGLCGVSLLAQDRRLADTMAAQDRLYTLLVRPPDGETRARIIGSVVDHRFAPHDPEAVLRLMASPQIRIITLTVTEAGYFYSPGDDVIDVDHPDLVHDARTPRHPRTAFGYLVEALRRRREEGTAPFTVQSCDNVHHNGAVAHRVVASLAHRVDHDLAGWIDDEVAFPNSMVDRITPRTAPADLAEAEALTGLTDAWPVPTESFAQWVIEDRFPAGRPAWETVGAELVDDVGPYELMKMRLLNAAHQTIAYPGKLLGHAYAHEAVVDPTIARLLVRFQHDEAVHTLTPIPGTDFDSYSSTVRTRFGNAHIADTVDRLAFQSSTMLSGYVLPVIRDLLDAGRDASAAIAVVACWARFLEGVDEQGCRYDVVDDRADDLTSRAARHDQDLRAVIAGNPLFVGLSDRPAFVEPYTRTLDDLRRRGTRQALAAIDRRDAENAGSST